jgi:hypothetical protein
MIIVGVDIDDVLRDFRKTVIYYYHKDNKLNYDNLDFENFTDKNLEEILDFKEISDTKYFIDNDLDVYYTTRDKITEYVETLTKEDQINRFLYEDYLLEIYGLSSTTYRNVGNDFNMLIKKYKDTHKFIILVKDKKITFSPTLSFISILKPFISEIKYVDNTKELIDSCDIYITSNESYINNEQNKKIILVNKPNVEHKFKIDRLGDLLENQILE